MLTLDQLVELEFELQESTWRTYEEVKRDNPDLLIFIPEPDPRQTKEQIAVRLAAAAQRRTNFTMKNVVTGARRKWK